MKIAVTPGEPAGIGPDIILQVAQHVRKVPLIVYASPQLLIQRAKQLNLKIKLVEDNEEIIEPGFLAIHPVELAKQSTAGQLDVANAAYVMESLKKATQDCMNNKVQALVTGPIHKGIINQSGIACSGHTEFLRDITNTSDVVMMLATHQLKVTLLTTHLPLAEVPKQVTAARLESHLKILHKSLIHYFSIEKPRIIVCGLNPHAGENGYLGNEEIEIINPVIKKLNQQGFNIIGALPADTVFTAKIISQADAVLTMYHDQGLPVLKSQGFGEAVNITLGLPIIRTSVDHGTALDIAGSGLANPSSLSAAIEMAYQMAQQK